MNNLLAELDNKDADELEDVHVNNVMADINKPIAFNKEDQLYSKYNVTLDTREMIEEKRISEQPMAPVGQI